MVLFGYSMGSFVCRMCLHDFGGELDAAVVCSSGNGDKELPFGIAAARAFSLFAGKKKATLLDGHVNRGFNKRTEHRTSVDWLSTDPSYLVKDGKPDPLCGFTFSNRGYYDLMTMIRAMLREDTFDAAPKTLPILFLSGEDDPVGGYGVRVKEAVEHYRATGHSRTELKLYPGRRHEIHLDGGRYDIWADMAAFLDRVIS